VIDKFLKANTGTLDDRKRLRGGQLLIKTNSQSYSNKLLGLSDLAGVPVKATPHRTLNSSKGVIRCSELKHASEDEIITELAHQGVVDSFNIKVKGQDGVRCKTNTYILTFNTSTVQNTSKLAFFILKLRCISQTHFGAFNVKSMSTAKMFVAAQLFVRAVANSTQLRVAQTMKNVPIAQGPILHITKTAQIGFRRERCNRSKQRMVCLLCRFEDSSPPSKPPFMPRQKNAALALKHQQCQYLLQEGVASLLPQIPKKNEQKLLVYIVLSLPVTRRIQSPCITNMAYWTRRWTILQIPNGYFTPVEPAWPAGQQR